VSTVSEGIATGETDAVSPAGCGVSDETVGFGARVREQATPAPASASTATSRTPVTALSPPRPA
jgi:hypothetical protein